MVAAHFVASIDHAKLQEVMARYGRAGDQSN